MISPLPALRRKRNLPPVLVDLELARHLESPPCPAAAHRIGTAARAGYGSGTWPQHHVRLQRICSAGEASQKPPPHLVAGTIEGLSSLGAWLSTSRGAQRLSATSTILARLIRSRSGDSLRHGTKNHKVCNDDVGVRRFRAGRSGAGVGCPSRARLRLSAAVSLVSRRQLAPRVGIQLRLGYLPRRLSPRYRRRQPRPRLARGPTWRPGAVAAWR